MKEIALHIMDIVENSLRAQARLIEISLSIWTKQNRLIVEIGDDGCGMSAQMLEQVTNPFVTTRTTRRVGLGISLFKDGAEDTGGSFAIESEPGIGTRVRAEYVLDHIDRQPIGDFAGTVHTLIVCNPDFDFLITVCIDGETQTLDTREIKATLGAEVPVNLPDVSMWLKENLQEMFPEKWQVV